jgi:chemotaxis protein CheD
MSLASRENLSEASATDASTRSAPINFYLHPGTLFTSAQAHAVTTILGSCIAVCLWDPVARMGGINHFLLPAWNGEGEASPRFGDVAIRELIIRTTAIGCDRRYMHAKLFGGACVLDAFQHRKTHLGAQNSDLAKRILRQEGIPLVGEDIGGRKGRKLIFHTQDGTAWVKQL